MRIDMILKSISVCVALFLFSVSDLLAFERLVKKDIKSSVIKIISTARKYNYYQPWQHKNISRSVGSGFVIDGNRILTNAHLVHGAVYISAKRFNDPKDYEAEVEFISDYSDLAVLKVKDLNFYKGIKPLKLGGIPALFDTVAVLGFPEGGEKISITKGVVSRVEQTFYSHSGKSLLAAQIDAAINSGNSGGPVILDGKVVGMAMQSIINADNIGFIITTPVIKSFLKDSEDGKMDGFPGTGISVESGESNDMKKAFKVDLSYDGVFVIDVVAGSGSDEVIRKHDFITTVDDIKIDNDGTFLLVDDIRVRADHLIKTKQVGDKVRIGIVRDGKKQQKTVTLKPDADLVPIIGSDPEYLIYGGLIFTKLTQGLLKEWGSQWYKNAPGNFLNYVEYGKITEKQKEIALLLKVLPHDSNVGFHDVAHQVIDEINSVKISSFADIPRAILSSKDRYARILLEGSNQIVVIDNEKALKYSDDILRRYNISSPCSVSIAAVCKDLFLGRSFLR